MLFVCREDNDLFQAACRAGVAAKRFNDAHEALLAAVPGDSLACLADTYPRPALDVQRSALERFKELDLRVYIEYPKRFPGLTLGQPTPTEWERVAVSSDFFAPELANETILVISGCWLTPIKEAVRYRGSAHLMLGRMAGYDRAVFGVPEDACPILVERADAHVLVSATSLSRFITGRYAPQTAWKRVWERLLAWLARGERRELDWEPAVRVHAGPREILPPDIERQAFERSVSWYVHHAVFSRDRKKGVIEGFQSEIDHCGRQSKRVWVRADCLAESAMVLAYHSALTNGPDTRRLATQILEYVWDDQEPDFLQTDPQSPMYGLVNWYERGEVFYGDDNARVILASLVAAGLLEDDRWDERILRCILANLRTTGPLGFRRDRINRADFFGHGDGWRRFWNEETISYAPHYQSYLWTTYLWIHLLTGHEIFVKRTLTGIRMTMEAYPRWKWSNGITQEIARMILPLAFLARIDPNSRGRSWLDRLTGDLLAQMDECGAIREKLGHVEDGIFSAPKSNEAYGTAEAPVIQQNGDPASDLLYTVNFAFLGLREAAIATGDDDLKKAEDKMAEFLCRIQVRSERHPYLDGTWMRSFDHRYWEYWGSSADAGWGPWCVESGWSNSWIATVLAMRCAGDALFHDGLAERMKRLLPKLLREMELEDHG